MKILRINEVGALLAFVLLFNGCMRFTQRDYELQEKAYQKQEQQEQMNDNKGTQIHW